MPACYPADDAKKINTPKFMCKKDIKSYKPNHNQWLKRNDCQKKKNEIKK